MGRTPPEAIDATVYSMSMYGQAVSQSNNQLIAPHLPARLGQETGSDATLYIGGWTYVGDDSRAKTGKKIVKGVAIGLLVVALAAVIVIAVAGAGKGGGGGGGVGKLLGGAGRVAAGAGRAVVTVGRVAGKVTGGVLRGLARSGPRLMRGTLRTMDAFGRSNTHLDLRVGNMSRPNYYKRDKSPKKGRSQMYLEMTLIDNHTGNVLWHARQRMPANAGKAGQVRKAFSRMMASLPGA